MKKIIFFLSIIIITLNLAGCGKSKVSFSDDREKKVVEDIVEESVKSSLDYPDSAKFIDISKWDIRSSSSGKNDYVVKSYVYSKNSSGTDIKSNFTMLITVVYVEKNGEAGYVAASQSCEVER